MQVILLEKVQNLGDLGEEVSVKSGFGRNFLIPAGRALAATKSNREKFEARRAELEAAAAKVLEQANARQQKLQKAGAIQILVNASVEGKLFGSVSASDIADKLNEAGADVDSNEVRLPSGPLRHTGDYEIDVQLHADVLETVQVSVTSEAEIQARAEAEEARKAREASRAEAEAIAKAQEEA